MLHQVTLRKGHVCRKNPAKAELKSCVLSFMILRLVTMAGVTPTRSSRGQTHKAHNTQNECQILELNLLFQSFFVRRREIIMNSLQ